MKIKLTKLDTTKIVQTRLKETQYYQEEFPKKQIVIHHTVSNGNAKNVVAWWGKTPARIGVAFVIDREGIIHQCFSSKHWANHLGIKGAKNTQLNQQSIGIELCAWGSLKRSDLKSGIVAQFTSSTGSIVSTNEVIELEQPFRGSKYYQKYTNKQLKTLQILLNYLCETYNIPNTYNSDMWDYSRAAMNSSPGIFTHVSFRKDKSDCFPQIELIKIIQNLK
jgi:N-acetyl-anhydromuramyl-L-alanine amidase AmpD